MFYETRLANVEGLGLTSEWICQAKTEECFCIRNAKKPWINIIIPIIATEIKTHVDSDR